MSDKKTDKDDMLKTQLQKRFENYKYPVPDDGLWTRIEKTVQRKKSKGVARRRTIGFIAAIAACTIILFLFVPRFEGNDNNNILVQTADELNTTHNIKKDILVENQTSESSKNKQPKTIKLTAKKAIVVEVEPNIIDSVSKEKVTEKQNIDNEVEKKTDSIKIKKIEFAKETLLANNIYTKPTGKNKSKNIDLALSSSNLLANNMGDKENINRISDNSITNEAVEIVEKNIEYDHPLNFGVLIRKNITNKFAIESGLTYTYLSSKETLKSRLINERNKLKLHYVGIPIKAIYNFYSTDRLSLYGGAGITFEKAVSGSSTDKTGKKSNLKISEIQTSASFLGGINYRIIDKWGLFVEPNVSYFFDDGSSVQTIRKDKPFNFNIQGGIRYTY